MMVASACAGLDRGQGPGSRPRPALRSAVL